MDYSKMSNEEFDSILAEVMDDEGNPSGLLSIPGIHEIVSEHFNNEVLERWEATQEPAMPKPRYILIEVDEFGSGWEGEETADELAAYLLNELENKQIISGGVNGFENWEALLTHIDPRIYSPKENTNGETH